MCKRRAWVQKVEKTIAQRGGQRLGEFRNATDHVLVKCGSCSHEWGILPGNLLKGKWCKHCSHKRVSEANQKEAEEDIKAIFKKRGATLERVFLDDEQVRRAQGVCKNGHYINMRYTSLNQGSWCSKCVADQRGKDKKEKLISRRLQSLEQLNLRPVGGPEKLLSKGNKVLVVCKKCNYELIKHYSNLGRERQKSGCPKCNGRVKTVEDMQELAVKRGLKFTDSEYRGVMKKHSWECRVCENSFLGTPDAIRGSKNKSPKSCPHCRKFKYTLLDGKALANEKGGKCLELISNRGVTTFEFECGCGKSFVSNYNDAKLFWSPCCGNLEQSKKAA